MEDDCYSTVYSWFDKSGIISNIRTHLRYNLVNALKNKDLSSKFDSNITKSPKQYIYDLLIADYLWNHNYAYTLSVFTSEAPLLVNFKKCVQPSTDKNCINIKQKLQNDYVCHVLETLGIEPAKAKGQNIIREYADNDVPLLISILQYIKSIDTKFNALNEAQSKPKNVKHEVVQTEENENVVFKEKSKIETAKKKLIYQKDLFNAQLIQKETELKEQTTIMEKQLLTLQNKLEEAQKLMYIFDLKEKQFNENKKQESLRILQKENELSMREKLLSQEADRLEKERDSYRQFESNLKRLQSELTKVKREIPRTKTIYNISIKDAQIQTDFESFILSQNERNLLNQEKQDLNGLVLEQQLRIEQLTSKVVYLLRKLEETQLKYYQKMNIPSIMNVISTNTVISENSSTEDILQDAKMRLRRLEEESIKADQYYFNFIANSSQ